MQKLNDVLLALKQGSTVLSLALMSPLYLLKLVSQLYKIDVSIRGLALSSKVCSCWGVGLLLFLVTLRMSSENKLLALTVNDPNRLKR